MRPVAYLVGHALTVAAIAALPLVAAAQTPTSSAAQPNPAAEHLAAARNALNKVLNSPAPNADAVKKLSEIKTEYIALEKSASTASPEWAAHYQMIDRLVGELLGPSPSSGIAGAVGTSGTSTATGVGANADMTTNLQSFRTELSAFSQAMSKVAAPASTSTASAPSTAAPPSTATAPSTAAAPSTATASAATATSAASAPATATAPAATASTATSVDASVLSKLDSVTTMLDAALKANGNTTSGPVSVDRALLEQMKLQLDQVKASLKKQ